MEIPKVVLDEIIEQLTGMIVALVKEDSALKKEVKELNMSLDEVYGV